tara:strand:- start:19 stop:1026 length:1008 start_codon:yes stop_codon:yes gene_type:complete
MSEIASGSIRFNTDSRKMEIWNGEQWWEIDSTSPEEQTGGTRGLNMAGLNPGRVDTIEFFNLDSTGNAADFGNLTTSNRDAGVASDRTRSILFGGSTPGTPNGDVDIEKMTIASTGNSTDFGGDLITGVRGVSGVSDRTRAIAVSGEHTSGDNIMQYVTIQSSGNAVDFGDLPNHISNPQASMSSPTRGLTSGRSGGNEIYYYTISTLGNAADFGNLTVRRRSSASASNAVRGIVFGGYTPSPSSYRDNIDFVTLATLGNAVEFGDMVTSSNYRNAACASPTKAAQICGRTSAGAFVNSIEYVQIMSTGNAIDFGDPSQNRMATTATSNGHGGLG